jgi:hypothetical protein
LTVTSPWMVSPPGASSAAVPPQRDSQRMAHRIIADPRPIGESKTDKIRLIRRRRKSIAIEPRQHDPVAQIPLGRKHQALLAHRRRRPDPQAPGPPRHPRQRPGNHTPLSTMQVAPPGSTAATTPRRRTSPVRCSGSEVVAMARPWRGFAQLTRGCIGLAGWPSAGSRARGDRVWDKADVKDKRANVGFLQEPSFGRYRCIERRARGIVVCGFTEVHIAVRRLTRIFVHGLTPALYRERRG